VQSDEEPVAPESGGVVVIPVGWTLTSTFKFVWDGWNLLAELDGEDGVLRACAWGLDLSGSEQGAGGVGGLVFEYLAKTDITHHLYYDGNGNVISLRDDAGAVSAAYEYGPFGETLTARGDEGALAYSAFKFSTKYADAESGLLYYGYRYYNPGTGRWLNRDPIEEDGGATLVAFAANAALTYLDPLGTDFIAVADRPVGGTAGAFHHYSVQYWTTDCNPDVGTLVQVATMTGTTKAESVELLRDGGWQAYRWRSGLIQFIHSGDWVLADVAVSTIHYSDSGIRLIPIYADTKAEEVKKRWGFILSHAREYEYAEQALPPGITTRVEWRHWAQSEYRIGDRFNNSNTFVREVVRRSQLPMYELPGSHPGLVTARRVPPPYKYGTTPFKGTPPPAPTSDGGALGVGYE
jgi:RHS repeat-associated protein